MVSGMPVEAGARAARARALAVLRIRGRALALALVPAAVAVILQVGGATGQFAGPGWTAARWTVTALAVLALLAAVFFSLVVTRSRPAVSPTVTIPESAAPDLYRLVRDLADRLEVPAPSAIALTPDCDSWLEDRTHPAHDEQAVPADPSTRADPGMPLGADGQVDPGARADAERGRDSGLHVDSGGRVHSLADRAVHGVHGHTRAETHLGAEAGGPGADALPVLSRPGDPSAAAQPGSADDRPAENGWATGAGGPGGLGGFRRPGVSGRFGWPRRRDRTGRAGGGARTKPPAAAPVLVIGSPFLWWMRVAELRALLAPVVAGTGPSAHPDIAAARRFVRGLDAAVAVAAAPGRGALPAAALRCVGWAARLLLRMCRDLVAEMERGVAVAAAERAQAVDYGLRIVAQEQVGLAYAGWDRLLTRVALPAWRMGRWPSRLDAGVVAALTELSRRDRLAEGFASRLGERPACDLLEEPGVVDEATSLLAARLFHGGPAEPGPDWVPVDWQQYPAEVVDRKWRDDAARLQRVLDTLGVRRPAAAAHRGGSDPPGASLARLMVHLSAPEPLTEPVSGPTPGSPAPGGAAPGGPVATGAQRTAGQGASGPAHDLGAASPSVPNLRNRRPGTRQGTQPDPQEHPDPASRPAPLDDLDEPGTWNEPDGRNEPGGRNESSGVEESAGPGERGGQNGRGAPSDRGAPDGREHPDEPGGAGRAGRRAPRSTDASGPHGDDITGPTAYADQTRAGGTGNTASAGRDAEHGSRGTEHALPGIEHDFPVTEHDRRSAALAAELSAELAREEAAHPGGRGGAPGASEQQRPDGAPWEDSMLPLFPMQPPRTGRELLADHVTAMVCCAAVDTAGAAPGLDWLDGPSLLVGGERAADLAPSVRSLIEDGDPEPLRGWLTRIGVRPEKPLRLV